MVSLLKEQLANNEAESEADEDNRRHYDDRMKINTVYATNYISQMTPRFRGHCTSLLYITISL
jgi:hypothetical protein